MPLDPALYTTRHLRPTLDAGVELVAYEKKQGGFHAFVFEPAGVCPPEWEAARVDANHLYLGEFLRAAELETIAAQVKSNLGPEYEKVLAFSGAKGGANVRMQRLHSAGATGYVLKQGESDTFELWCRRKDRALAER